jgi:two-component system, OmpR family, response regulator VicR
MSNKGKILLAEDDANLGFVVKDNLEDSGFQVELYTDGETALLAFERGEYDLCILDVMMPKKDGFSVAQTIRTKNQDVPIVFVTAKSLKEDRIKGFQLGADDYITKPFSIEELILRVEVILKRSKREGQPVQNKDEFLVGEFTFDFKNMVIVHKNNTQELTQREAELLRLLCVNKNQVVERDTILNVIWGDDTYFNGRSLDVFISRLRRYLKADANVEIANVHRVGFKLVEKEN